MIRPIDIRLNAAHPELKLPEAVTYTGAPSTVLVRGVPPNCGRWAITAVSVAATFPDGSTTTRAAVQSANGVWVATLPATATSGRTTDGFRVIADGIDENGEAVTGYIIAVADFAVASLDVTPAPQPGETSWQMLYFDAVPSTLRKGDVTKVDGVLKFYNGTAWEPFAAPVTFDNAVTKDSANGVKSSGIWAAIWGALASLPTGFSSLYDWVVDKLAEKLDANSGTMTGTFRLKGVLKVDTGDTTTYELDYYGIRIYVNGGTKQIYMPSFIPYADSGYMALVENLAPGFSTSATYYKDDLVKYNGTLYMCMATSHTGAWSNSDFAMASVQGALARKLGHEGPWVNGYIDVLERVTGESVPYGVRIYRDKIVFGAFTNTVPRGFTPIREFALPSAAGTLALLQNIAPNFSTSATYALDALCVYGGALYRCTTAVTTAGAWTGSTNWTAATVDDALAAIRAAIPHPSTSTPNPDGTGSAGSSTAYARGDHVHPSDSTKLNKSGGTMTGGLTMGGGNLITFSDQSGTRTMTIGINGDIFEINLYSYGTLVYTWRTPYNSGVFALASELSHKLDSTSAAPVFSTSSTYAVGEHVTYNGALYRCTTAVTTAGAWTGSTNWTADTMTDTIRYDRVTITTSQLQDHAEQKVTLNAATTTLTLPALTTGKVSDFGIDVVNGYEVSGTPTAASFTLDGTLGSDYNLIVPKGEDWSEMSALAAGEMAVYYFTLSAFQINDKPTWEVMKKVVELVPVPSAP